MITWRKPVSAHVADQSESEEITPGFVIRKGLKDSHGGWGHNPGFEGYGPIAMLTGQGALAYSLMHRCGIKIDRKKHDAAYEFLKKGTGQNGYVWYGDEVGGGPDGWADMGRTGAAGIANFLSPYSTILSIANERSRTPK